VAKVLLVDDESVVRSMLRRLFERGGFEVREAESGKEALEVVAADSDIAAVVSDFIMPTGAARDRTVHDLLEHRGVPMVSKLNDPQIVLDAVRC
jgi:CheY-like chemotaxis protein